MSSTHQNKIHPNANKQFDNLILGDSIIKRISHKLFSKHQEKLKISLSGRLFIYLFQILKTYIHAALHARWVLRCLKTAKYLQINKTDKNLIHNDT